MTGDGKYYVMSYAPGHILADENGNVRQHRLFLYQKIGSGPHPCYWCGVPVNWMPKSGPVAGALQVDHVNGNKRDNSQENLVPSCHTCNTRRGSRVLVRDDEVFVTKPNGRRVRGVQRSCESCSAKFVAIAYEVKIGRGRFCSPRCHYDSRSIK